MSPPVRHRSFKLRLAVAIATMIAIGLIAIVPIIGFLSLLAPIVAGFLFIRLGPYTGAGRAMLVAGLVIGLIAVVEFLIGWSIGAPALRADINSELEDGEVDITFGVIFLVVLIVGSIIAGIMGVILGGIGGLIGAATRSAPPVEQGYGQQQAPPVEPRDPNDPWA